MMTKCNSGETARVIASERHAFELGDHVETYDGKRGRIIRIMVGKRSTWCTVAIDGTLVRRIFHVRNLTAVRA